MKRFIIDFVWEDGSRDFRTVRAENKSTAVKVFRQGGSYKGSYKNVEITSIQE